MLERIARCFVIVLPCLWASVTAFALDPSRPLTTHAHRTWRSEDGLPQDTATALLEAKDGFLWIGTEVGLVRFDGTTFDRYSRINVPGFTHNAVQCLAEGQAGGIWIGTTEPGLYLFQRGTIQRFGAAEGLPEQPIHRLLRDRHGTLWVAPAEGPLLRFDGTRFLTIPSDAARLRIRALAEDRSGNLWVGTANSGLWQMQQDRLVLRALSGAEMTAIDLGPEGEVWVGTRSGGLLLLREGRLETPAWARSLPARPISALLADTQGSLWIGSELGGLTRRTRMGRMETVPGASGHRWTPLSLLEDSSGALWCGSEDRGLSVIYPVPFQAVPTSGPDPEEPASMVCQDHQGTVWCLTGDQSLGMLRDGRIERVPLRPALDSPITALWPRQAGGLWIGTRNGELHTLEQGRCRRIRGAEGAQSNSILALFEDARQTLWISTSRQGLIRLNPGGPPSLFPTIQGVQAMTGGGTGPLFLASRTLGLGVLEAGQVRWWGRAEGLGSSGALSLHLDTEGLLWIGTLDGLRLYREGALQTISDRSEPWRLPIQSILEDGARRLWFGTSQGVFRIPRATLLKALDVSGPIMAMVFDHHDGLPSREAHVGGQPTSWLTRNADLLFATSRGLARLERGAEPPAGPPLQLHILRAESDETTLPETHPLVVPPGTHRFEVYYTATSLTRADKVRFRYRLDGWEHIWNEVGERRFSAYSNLPPGSYRFILQAWRLGEHAPPQEQSIEIRVRPFFFQRPVFWLLGGISGAAFLWWLLRLRLQQVEARSAVLAERNRMAREIHDHLAQGFTGVLLQLEAAEAKLSRMQGDPAPVLTRLDHARNLAVASLQEARRSVNTLRPRKPEGADLLGALRSLADRLLAGTDIQVELAQTGVPRSLRGNTEEELLRMAQELLTNALRHGKARWVRVVLQFESRHVRLSIEDDGHGFDPTASAAGYGMRSIRDSLRQFRGHLEVDSTPGFGSRITITLPNRRWRL